MKKLLVFLKHYKIETIMAPLFKLLEASFELFVPLVMASLIDIGIGNKDEGYIIKCCVVLISLAVIGLVCAITAQYFAAKAATGFSTELRHALFSRIQAFSFSQIDKMGTSTLITRMTSDINQVQSGVNLVLRLFLRSPCIVFGAAIMAFRVDRRGAVVFAVVIPLLSFVVFSIMLFTMPLYKKVQSRLDQVLLVTRENLTGSRVLRAFNKEEDEKIRFSQNNQVLTNAQKYAGRISALMNPITYLIVNGGLICLIYLGAVRVNIGALTQGQVVALINYMSQILVELIKLANLIITVTKSLASADRIKDIIETEPEQMDGNEREAASLSGPEVEFKNVSLTYKNAGEETLTDISFAADKGEIIGVIGGTGSGKTSLVHLIPGYYRATGGEIKIFGKNIDEYAPEFLRKKVGMVFQKAVLFKGSIKENICWGNENASDEEVETALRISQAEEVVKGKKEGLQFLVEQGGKNLSGGQRQRLTIARALLGKPDILILDDSSSALDYATDARLRKELWNMKDRPLIFLVSQRTATVRWADRILVLDDGRLVGNGKHEELLEHCEVYREIYHSQFSKEVAVNE